MDTLRKIYSVTASNHLRPRGSDPSLLIKCQGISAKEYRVLVVHLCFGNAKKSE